MRFFKAVVRTLHSHQFLRNFASSYLFYFVRAITMGQSCYLIVLLICISLIIHDAGPLFTYLLPTYVSSLEKWLRPLPILSPDMCFSCHFVLLWLLSGRRSFCILEIHFFIRYMFCKYFLSFHRFPFHCVVFIPVQKFWSLS